MKRVHLNNSSNAGFTLVELAIVLVIIGLIIGGVLVGQDLIKAAEIRSTTAEIERYNAAANTFRNKYNGLPGDLRASRALQAGMITRPGDPGQGDGNGLIEGCGPGTILWGCEGLLFWTDLTNAQLIANAFDSVQADQNTGQAAGDVDTVARFLPAVSLRDTAFVSVIPTNGRNYYLISSMTSIAAGAPVFAAPGLRALSPLEASQIDEKMDDGRPETGIVRAVSNITPGSLGGGATTGTVTVDPGVALEAPPPATTCVVERDSAEPTEYYLANADAASNLNCSLLIRASF